MADFLSISEVADRFGVQPRYISDLFYRRHLDARKCVVKASRRLIPVTMLPQIERVIRQRKK